jgi:two-component system capsular synthesis sensor histidine kinase RcsC
MLNRAGDPGTLLFVSAAQGVVTSAPPATPAEVSRLQAMSRDAARDRFTYARTGVLLAEPTTPPVGSLIYFLSYRQLAATLAGQFAIIALLSLLIIAAILLTARFWGMRLLRQSHAETARALESETINHILVSATPVGLCIVRQRDYSLLTSNQLAAVLLHLDSATTLPPHVVSAFREQGGHEPATSTFAKIAGFIVPAFPDQQRDAHPQFLQITYAPARYAGEDVLFCAILDVTAQQTLEQELRSAQHASETMMRARSNFFASMSHEIRTPLNALLGNLELLSRSPGLKPHEQRLRAVGMAADGLRRIVNDILDFSKIDAGEMKLVMENFRPIDDLESLALSYAPMSADRPVRFYAHLAVTLDQVLRGDRARIAQIINNLLSNAFKFTSCGKITLNAEVLRDVQDRDILVCRVCDSGIGMDAVLVSKIFSPFVQAEASTSSRYGGTGLGLSICAKLCELMGGQISVESVPGVGTAFTVMIPLETLHDSSLLVTAPVQRGNVLVLCQEIESGKFIEPWMNRGGWLCNTVVSRRAAEASLLNNGPHFMIVTGEYGMEDIVALRAVRAVPVIWITRTAPHRAVRHGDGIFEVSEFNHKVTLACIERALGESPGESDAAPAVPTAVNCPDPALDGLVILVAEDNPLNQALIAEQLDTLGCQPIIVGDGRQALAALQSTEVDIVLSDIHMPVMDGHELLEHLRASHSHLPVLAFSAVTSNEQAEDWRARGFADYVAKPASLKELETALLRVVRGWPANAAPAGVNAGAATTEKAGPSPAGMDPAEKARYMAMLRDYLITDLPKLEAIIGSQDAAALRQWTHSSAGAFLVVQEHELATQCRELERLCDAETEWTTDMAQRALNLHTALHERFGLGGDAA